VRIEERIGRLERMGGGDCPRCSGVFAIIVNGKFCRATRHGEPMSEEEYRQYVSEKGPGGECPGCGRIPGKLKVGGPGHATGYRRRRLRGEDLFEP